MDRDSSTRRRDVLGAVAAGTPVAFAGCLSGGGGGDTTTGSGGDGSTGGGASVAVGPNGDFAFDPESVTVAVGETVTWTWESDTHNIVVDSQPDGADWSGTDGGSSTTYDTGHEYSYTFEVAGTYEYFCNPHEGLGMVGTVVVEEG